MLCSQMVRVRYLLLLLWAFSSFANGQLLQLLNQQTYFGAEFSKTVSNKRGAILEMSTGSIQLVRPNKILWQEDNGDMIIANSDQVYLYRTALNQVQVQKLEDALSNTPAGLLLTPSKRLMQDYDITTDDYDGVQTFYLVPKKLEGFVRSFRLSFSGKQLNSFALTDWQYNTILLSFSANSEAPPADSIFEFNITPDMEVIR